MTQHADMIRDVPETAVRLFLGASIEAGDGLYTIGLDGRKFTVTADVYEKAENVARALAIRERSIQYASDVLELRHDAEDIFLNEFFQKDVPRVLFVPSGEMASAFYRARLPADIATGKGTLVSGWTDRLDLSKAMRYDILWIQLVSSPIILSIAQAAKEQGIKIVYDFDDRFDSILPDNPAAAVYVREKQDEIWTLIEMADMVTVSTEPLADFVRTRFPEKDVRVLPNYVPASICPRKAELDPKVFKILWAGSPTHRKDLAIMAPALHDVLAAHKGAVKFYCFGETMPEALVPVREHVELMKFVPFVDYMDELTAVGADLMVAPLTDNEFNASKSAVKALEAAACGYPILMSPVGEYPELVKAGFPGTLVPDDQWKAAFELSINFRDKLSERGKSAKEWTVKNRCIISSNATPWVEAAKALACERSVK
jgi:glycosyltransferase involved in cell wall biosynthesis